MTFLTLGSGKDAAVTGPGEAGLGCQGELTALTSWLVRVVEEEEVEAKADWVEGEMSLVLVEG
jgi:hypothetical protein